MYHLATVIPALRRVKLPLSRDQIMLLMCAVNEIFLAIDIYLAHSISGTIIAYEWIPIIFGIIAGILLLVAGAIASRNRTLGAVLATLVMLASIAVGLLGAYFHFRRASLPTGPGGWTVSVNLLVWAPPILAPFTFSLVGLLGILAVWDEVPPDSGRLLIGRFVLRMPYSKTRAYFFLVGMGILATVISSVLDHARTPFVNNWLWVPTTAGVFGTLAAVALGVIEKPIRADLIIYLATMILLILVGLVGAWLHINLNLIAGGVVVPERFIRGAPFLAPLLFSDMGVLGIIAMLDPIGRHTTGK